MAHNPVPVELSGLALVDKPQGMTSHDVVSVMRKAFNTRKVGHAGTLDPAATGVLIIGVGRATKLLGLLQLENKSYETTIVLGVSTTTEDADGDVLRRTDPHVLGALTPQRILQTAEHFVGEIEQVPSAVSAIKVDGMRAYERVRRGETVELKPRPVTIYQFQIDGIKRQPSTGYWEVRATVECSSGTYIRALARDFGRALGADAHITALRRTRVGDFCLNDAHPLAYYRQCIDNGERPPLSLSLDEATQRGRQIRSISAQEAHKLALGQRITLSGLAGVYAAVDEEGRTVALLKEDNGKMSFVFVVRPSTLN